MYRKKKLHLGVGIICSFRHPLGASWNVSPHIRKDGYIKLTGKLTEAITLIVLSLLGYCFVLIFRLINISSPYWSRHFFHRISLTIEGDGWGEMIWGRWRERSDKHFQDETGKLASCNFMETSAEAEPRFWCELNAFPLGVIEEREGKWWSRNYRP